MKCSPQYLPFFRVQTQDQLLLCCSSALLLLSLAVFYRLWSKHSIFRIYTCKVSFHTKASQKSDQSNTFHPVSLYQQPVPCTAWDTCLVTCLKNLGTNFFQKDLNISFLTISHQSLNPTDILWEWKPTLHEEWRMNSSFNLEWRISLPTVLKLQQFPTLRQGSSYTQRYHFFSQV